jgi:hypothetical protein
VEIVALPIDSACLISLAWKAEKKYQQQWSAEGLFRQDAPAAGEGANKHPKFYGTMAYPYMNGTLHAGHAFTASKIGLRKLLALLVTNSILTIHFRICNRFRQNAR